MQPVANLVKIGCSQNSAFLQTNGDTILNTFKINFL